MAIPVVREPEGISLERMGFERCFFCTKKTTFWHERTNNPVCQLCAGKHKVSELPDHGANIRKVKKAESAVTAYHDAKCKNCRRPRGKHKAGDLACPFGRGSFPQFYANQFYEPVK